MDDILVVFISVLSVFALAALITYCVALGIMFNDIYYMGGDPLAVVALYTSDQSVFLKPTKTASRAVTRSLKDCNCKNPPIIPNGHHLNPTNITVPARDYFIVMRHPYERALSAFSFRKQGGENGDEEGTENVKFVRQYETLEDLVVANPEIESLPLLETRHQYITYFKQDPTSRRPIHPICYPNLDKEWPSLVEHFGCDECTLQVVNTSSKKKVLGPKTKQYIDKHLAGDIALYKMYCGSTANVTYQ
jgi:hypothetical protein